MTHPAARKTLTGQLGWIAYELAGGPYFNAVKIFVFAPFFTGAVVGDAVKGQEYWGYIDVAAGLCIALLSPMAGALGDAFGARKPAMLVLTLITAAAMACLWFAMPGGAILPVAMMFVVTAVAAELALLYHNSLLGWIAPPERIGLISGFGYSATYLSTLIFFIPWLIWFGTAETPAFGLDAAQGQHIRIVAPASALWFLAFAVLFFRFTPDAPRTGLTLAQSFTKGGARLRELLSKVPHYHNIARYLVSRMIYFDGLVAIFTFSGVYASGIFSWSEAQVGLYGLMIFTVLIFTGILGGAIDDWIGSRATILLGLAGTAAGLLFALSLGPGEILFGFVSVTEGAVQPLPLLGGLFAAAGFKTLPEQLFVIAGTLASVFMGPTLASSRTLMARLAPAGMMSEFFGLYSLTGKATAFVAPGAIALMTRAAENQRTGFAIVFVFLVIGFIGMLTVKEVRAEAHG